MTSETPEASEKPEAIEELIFQLHKLIKEGTQPPPDLPLRLSAALGRDRAAVIENFTTTRPFNYEIQYQPQPETVQEPPQIREEVTDDSAVPAPERKMPWRKEPRFVCEIGGMEFRRVVQGPDSTIHYFGAEWLTDEQNALPQVFTMTVRRCADGSDHWRAVAHSREGHVLFRLSGGGLRKVDAMACAALGSLIQKVRHQKGQKVRNKARKRIAAERAAQAESPAEGSEA